MVEVRACLKTKEGTTNCKNKVKKFAESQRISTGVQNQPRFLNIRNIHTGMNNIKAIAIQKPQ
jgi:hypothetical protein